MYKNKCLNDFHANISVLMKTFDFIKIVVITPKQTVVLRVAALSDKCIVIPPLFKMYWQIFRFSVIPLSVCFWFHVTSSFSKMFVLFFQFWHTQKTKILSYKNSYTNYQLRQYFYRKMTKQTELPYMLGNRCIKT